LLAGIRCARWRNVFDVYQSVVPIRTSRKDAESKLELLQITMTPK
jgi:hypothetical protein